MSPDAVKLHILYRDTIARLDVLSKGVRECRNLDEAADFARYVLNSVAPLLKLCPIPDPFPCDGHLVNSLAQTLLSDVQDRWRLHDMEPRLDLSELTAIHRKLDLLAGHVARISPMMPAMFFPPAAVETQPTPAAPPEPRAARPGEGGISLLHTQQFGTNVVNPQ
jgi:hypothetical protein